MDRRTAVAMVASGALGVAGAFGAAACGEDRPGEVTVQDGGTGTAGKTGTSPKPRTQPERRAPRTTTTR